MGVAALKEKADKFESAKHWIPQKKLEYEQPQELGGELIALSSFASDFEDPNTGQPKEVPVLVIDDEATGETWRFTAYSAVAQARIAQANPVVGQTVLIKYKGIGEAKPGRQAPYLFTVYADGDSAGVTATTVVAEAEEVEEDLPF